MGHIQIGVEPTSNPVRVERFTLAIFMGVLLATKLVDPQPTFAVFEKIWGLSPTNSVGAFVLLTGLEAIVVGLLLNTRRVGVGLSAAAVFLLAASVSIIRQRLIGSTMSCGCGSVVSFSSSQGPLSQWLSLLRNMVLLALCAAGLLRQS